MTRLPEGAGGTVQVRPAFLTEAARGATASVSAAHAASTALARAPRGGAVWGPAAPAFARFAQAWAAELDRAGHDGEELAGAVESAALAYVSTDAHAAGLSRGGP